MDIGRGDVPTVEGASATLPALAPPRADPLGGEPRGDTLGLLVGVPLDLPPVGRNDDEACVPAIIPQPLDELAVGLGLGLGIGRMRYLRVERTGELFACAESLPTGFAHANDVVRALLTDLAHRIQPVLVVVALDPDLMPERAPERRELLRVGRAMLLVFQAGVGPRTQNQCMSL